MKRYGDTNIIQSDVLSDDFISGKQFNKLVVNVLSEVDQETLDREVIIFNKNDDHVYTYNSSKDSWTSFSKFEVNLINNNDDRDRFIVPNTDIYNIIQFEDSILSVSEDLFDFGPIGSPVDFVIDFWLTSYIKSGTILYNGLNTGHVDLEQNKNLLITTSGSELVKDPNYQSDPTIVTHSENDGYINIARPNLKSFTTLIDNFLIHVALIRSGPTTYLAIDGKIEDSAPSVEYFHYDDVLIGGGYVGNISAEVINLRVTKGTDLGWTTDFTPPNYNPTPDVNTDFLMDSTSNVLVDNAGNYDINIVNNTPLFKQDKFYYQLLDTDYDKVISGNGSSLYVRFPDNAYDMMIFEFENMNKLVVYSGINYINSVVGYSVNCAFTNVPNWNHHFIFHNNQWYEKSSGLKNYCMPKTIESSLSRRVSSYTYAVSQDGNFLEVGSNNSVKLDQFKDIIDVDNSFPARFNFPRINCDLINNSITIPTYFSSSGSASYEFVFKVNSYIPNLITVLRGEYSDVLSIRHDYVNITYDYNGGDQNYGKSINFDIDDYIYIGLSFYYSRWRTTWGSNYRTTIFGNGKFINMTKNEFYNWNNGTDFSGWESIRFSSIKYIYESPVSFIYFSSNHSSSSDIFDFVPNYRDLFNINYLS